MTIIKKQIKKFKVAFIGSLDWRKMRDFLVLKLRECEKEEDFNFIIEALISSMFRSAKEMDIARKKLRLKLLNKKEKERIRNIMKGKK